MSQGGPEFGISHGIEVGLSRRALSPSGLRVCMSVLAGRLPQRLGAGGKEGAYPVRTAWFYLVASLSLLSTQFQTKDSFPAGSGPPLV